MSWSDHSGRPRTCYHWWIVGDGRLVSVSMHSDGDDDDIEVLGQRRLNMPYDRSDSNGKTVITFYLSIFKLATHVFRYNILISPYMYLCKICMWHDHDRYYRYRNTCIASLNINRYQVPIVFPFKSICQIELTAIHTYLLVHWAVCRRKRPLRAHASVLVLTKRFIVILHMLKICLSFSHCLHNRRLILHPINVELVRLVL